MKLTGVDILDGHGWRRGVDVEIAHGKIAAIRPGTAAKGAPILCPAPIDLQVNGGGGRMLGEAARPPATCWTSSPRTTASARARSCPR
jgi:N-acetylglucosamine-6-phosphate deacetylase